MIAHYTSFAWDGRSLHGNCGIKAVIPPLGIITVAALLPSTWDIRFYDRNGVCESEADWEWCDLVILSTMIVQKMDFQALIRKAVQSGKKVAVGGPYPTSVPQDALDVGAHFLILDEGEMTIPQFLEAIERGDMQGTFRSIEKPDVTQSPIPTDSPHLLLRGCLRSSSL